MQIFSLVRKVLVFFRILHQYLKKIYTGNFKGSFVFFITFYRDHMESEKAPDPYEDSRDQSRMSRQSLSKESKASSSRDNQDSFQDRIHNEDEKNGSCNSRSKTRRWNSDPDRDRISDEEERRSDGSYCSEGYEKDTLSERSLSSLSRSLTPSPTPPQGMRAKQAPRNAHRKAGE